MSFKLKKFDFHSKAIDGVTEQTATGAVVTLIMYGFIAFLLYSEFTVRKDNDIVSRMVLDASGSARRILDTRIEFDMDFYKVACTRVSFTQEVTRGEHHGDPAKTIVNKVPTLTDQEESCHVFGTLVTDKVGGNFRFEIAALESPVQVEKIPDDLRRRLLPGMIDDRPNMIPPDISHKINHILFLENNADDSFDEITTGASYDNMLKLESRPLNGQESNVPIGVGIHQYSIQIVPTTYKSYKDKPKKLNQYSVTERQVDFAQALGGVTIAGQFFSDFIGVVFAYDFYPVRFLRHQFLLKLKFPHLDEAWYWEGVHIYF